MMNQIIKEDLLHFVWKTKQFNLFDITTTEGEPVTIEEWGIHNKDSGPDFFNGKIKIGNTLWAGNIEMHVFSSDWVRHSHDSDPAYDNVVLHVVYEEDTPILNHENKRIPCIQLVNRIPNDLKTRYGRLIHNESEIPCQNLIGKVDKFTIEMWKERLVAERLEEKANKAKLILEKSNGDWETTIYILLSRYMGSRVNTQPFELLAELLSIKTLHKNKDKPHHLESLLFGTAGMLAGSCKDDYYKKLKEEYGFLKSKYNIESVPAVMWKFSRMRPPNFPTVRIAQLASIIKENTNLFSQILEEKEVKKLRLIFTVSASSYWDNHYRFGKISKETRPKQMTDSFIDLILINVVAPLLFLYGLHISNTEYQERAVVLLESIKSEKNSIISKWERLGIKSTSAKDTQSLIHLKNKYCINKKCLSCNIGSKIVHKVM